MNTIRSVFADDRTPKVGAPPRVTFQMLNDSSYVMHNYNQQKASVTIQMKNVTKAAVDRFTGDGLPVNGNTIKIEMEPRSRIWVQTR